MLKANQKQITWNMAYQVLCDLDFATALSPSNPQKEALKKIIFLVKLETCLFSIPSHIGSNWKAPCFSSVLSDLGKNPTKLVNQHPCLPSNHPSCLIRSSGHPMTLCKSLWGCFQYHPTWLYCFLLVIFHPTPSILL